MPLERFRSGGRFEQVGSYCRAVRAGPLIVVSGSAAIDNEGQVLHPQDTYAQTEHALRTALNALSALGGTRETVMRSRVLLAPNADWRGAIKAHGETFHGVDPANTTYYVHGFIPEGVLVEVELDAIVADDRG